MPWLLYQDGPGSPSQNMAKDDYILAHAASRGVPVLRLYQWDRLTLSVGRGQKVSRSIDEAACDREGIPLVRRITGGRAVLHGSDLTYSVAAPTSLPFFQGGILTIYRNISQVFVSFFHRLGYDPQVKTYSGHERAVLSSPICFSTPSAFEIMIEGKKLVGSAQRLMPNAFLQHGSIPLSPQSALLARLFLNADEDEVSAQMTDLESLGLMGSHSLGELRGILVECFADVLEAEFDEVPWEPEDEAGVKALMNAYPFLSDNRPSGE